MKQNKMLLISYYKVMLKFLILKINGLKVKKIDFVKQIN